MPSQTKGNRRQDGGRGMFLLENSQPNTRDERRSARITVAERYPDEPGLVLDTIEALGLLPEEDPE